MANRREKVEATTDFIFLGSKITADDDCSQEIKACSLEGKLWQIYSILKSRNITWLTKLYKFKPMVFPVVMYGCECWTIKKAKCQIYAFKLWCWRRLLRVSWTARRSNQSILKEINPEYSLGGLMLKLQHFGHLMWRANSLERPWYRKDWRQEEKGATEDELVGWHHRLSGHEFEQTPGDSERQGSLACCSPRGHKESDTTKWLNNNKR